jgi:hypothetical protein
MASGGHGDHWYSIRQDYESFIESLISSVVANGRHIPGISLPFSNLSDPSAGIVNTAPPCVANGLHTTGEAFDSIVVVVTETNESTGESQSDLWTGYPFCGSGGTYRLTIKEIDKWDNGIEAVIFSETDDGLSVNFFDLLYFRHGPDYEIGATYDFEIGGLISRLRTADPSEFPLDRPDLADAIKRKLGDSFEMPKTVTSKGAAILMPRGFPDEYTFHGPVRSIDQIAADGRVFHRLVVTCLYGENDFDLPMLAAEHVVEGGPPNTGQDVEGTVWLHGKLLVK